MRARKQSFLYLSSRQIVDATIYPDNAPTLTAPETLVAADASVAGILFTAELNGANDIILSGNWVDGLSINAVTGEKGTPKRFVNESTGLIGTSSKAATAFGVIGSVNYVEIYGLNKDTPMRISAGAGQSGFVFNPTPAGTRIRIYNAVGKDIGYSTLLFTATSTGSYRIVNISWVARNGTVTEGEHLYFGHVSTERIFTVLVSVHCSALDAGREGLQIKWTENFRVYNHTYRNVGQVVDTAQQHGFQWEVSNGAMYDMIFDGAKRSFNIFAHGSAWRGGYMRYTGAGFIGLSSSFWPGNPKLNGFKIFIEGVTFLNDSGGSNKYLAQWAETGCDFEFKDCVFSDNHHSNIIEDIRVGGSNSIIGTTTTNGNTTLPAATILALRNPSYISDVWTVADFNNLTRGSYWFNQGVGKGSPTKRTIEILDGKEVATEVVAFDTPYASLIKPTTAEFMLSNGKWVTLDVTWAIGAYDQDLAGTYTIYGTPTGYANTLNIQTEKDVEVLAYVNPNTARVNLTGSAGSYVGSGNWNNILTAGFSTGVQTIKGDSAAETLASIRNVGGTLTGYGLTVNSGFDTGALGEDSGGGIFPNPAIIGSWANPGGSGTSRSFKFTGLDNTKTYTISTLSSVDVDIVGSSHLVTIEVSGGSGGSTVTNYEADGNKNVLNTFTGCVPTAGGEITIRVEKRTAGQAVINAIEFEWT